MNTSRTLSMLLLTAMLLACARIQMPSSDVDPDGQPSTAMGSAVKRAMDEAHRKLATENISLSDDAAGLPEAAVTPQGDLLVDGRKVDVTDAQRALLLKHRANIVAVAEAGMAIGVQGADLGIQAAGEAIKGVFTGGTDHLDKRIEAEAKKIERGAQRLCESLPAVLASQNALEAALPAFAPYATMDQSDVDECKSGDHRTHLAAQDQARLRDDIRNQVRGAIQSSVRSAAQGAGLAEKNAAAEAEEAKSDASSTR